MKPDRRLILLIPALILFLGSGFPGDTETFKKEHTAVAKEHTDAAKKQNQIKDEIQRAEDAIDRLQDYVSKHKSALSDLVDMRETHDTEIKDHSELLGQIGTEDEDKDALKDAEKEHADRMADHKKAKDEMTKLEKTHKDLMRLIKDVEKVVPAPPAE